MANQFISLTGVVEVEREEHMVKIMIVDNHSLMRRAVREVIEQEGDLSVVAEACNGFEAEALAVETQPDVILMDLDIPGGNGFGMMERIRTCCPNACIMIFMTSHHEQHVFQALQNGAMGYLTKDVEPDALVHAIRCAARNDLCISGTLASSVMAHLRNIWQAQETMTWHPAREKGEDKGLSFTQALTACWSPGSIPDAMTSMAATAYRRPRRARRARATDPQDPTATPRPPRPLTGRERQILDQMRQGRKNKEIAIALDMAESTVHKHVQNIFEKLHARNRTEAIYLTSSRV